MPQIGFHESHFCYLKRQQVWSNEDHLLLSRNLPFMSCRHVAFIFGTAGYRLFHPLTDCSDAYSVIRPSLLPFHLPEVY